MGSSSRGPSSACSLRFMWVSLTVADDGEGTPKGASEKGFGLATLGERAGSLGGLLSAGNASEGGGFVMRVELPVEKL